MALQLHPGSEFFPFGLICIASILSGCGNGTDVDSEQVVTSSIWAGMEFTSKGDGRTGIKVELNEGSSNGPNIRLSANERLEVNAGGLVTTLREDIDILDIDYEGIINTDAFNTLFRVSLFRADGTINNGSTINIPAPFVVSSPSANQSIRVGDIMSIRWSPADPGREISLEFTTLCSTQGQTSVRSRKFDISDSGSIDFDTARISDAVVLSRCDLTVTLDRFTTGALDPAFRGGGYVGAVQTREIEGSISR